MKHPPRIAGITLIATIILHSTPAFASLTIAEVTQLSFGGVEIPSFGTATLTVDPDGTGTSGSATLIHNTASHGQYLLSSTEASGTISIDIQDIATGSPALTLSNFKGRYGNRVVSAFPIGALPVPGAGTMLNLGAELRFTSAVTEQPYMMYYDIVVNYE